MDLNQLGDHTIILIEDTRDYSQLNTAKYIVKAKESSASPNINEIAHLNSVFSTQDHLNNGSYIRRVNHDYQNFCLQNVGNFSKEDNLSYKFEKCQKNEPLNYINQQVKYTNVKVEFPDIKVKNEFDNKCISSSEENLNYAKLKMEPQKIESQVMNSCFEPSDIKLFACSLCSYKSNKIRNLRTHELRTHIATETFQCDQCEFKTKYARNLRLHTLKHTGEKPLKCDQCDYRTPSSSNLNRHKRVHLSHETGSVFSNNKKKQNETMNGEKPFRCTQCDFTTHNKNNLRQHQQRHNGLKPYQCEICEFCTSTNYSLKRHMVLHTRNQDFQCSLCNFQTKNEVNFKSHQDWHNLINNTLDNTDIIKNEMIKKEPEESQNELYNESLQTEKDLISNVESNFFKCSNCQFIGNIIHLRTHFLMAHPEIKPSFLDSPFIIKTEPEKEKKKRNKNKLYKCDQCEFVSSAFEKLKLHKWIHIRDKPFQCDQCNYRTVKRYLLVIHQRQHTGERPFRCDQCDYGAASRDTLRRHKLKHVGGKLFRCEQCGYRTATSTSLRIHMLSHGTKNLKNKRHKHPKLPGKKFPCNQCDYVTIKNSILILHKQKHIEEKPYQCQECDFNGQSYLALQRHVIRHRKEKLFKCDYCEFETSANKYLKTHMLNIHADEITIQCEDSNDAVKNKETMCNEYTINPDISYASVILDFSETAKNQTLMTNNSNSLHENYHQHFEYNAGKNVESTVPFKIQIKTERPDSPSSPSSKSSQVRGPQTVQGIGHTEYMNINLKGDAKNWLNYNALEVESISKDRSNIIKAFISNALNDTSGCSNNIKAESSNNHFS